MYIFSDNARLAICPKNVYIFRTTGGIVTELSNRMISMMSAGAPGSVWVPADFVQLGSRDLVDKTLQRLVASGKLRRIDRGLYDIPSINRLTNRPSVPDYRAVVEAVARRDQIRVLVDGITATNDLGLTDAVPARVTLHTDARRRSIKLENLLIEFKHTAPSRLYWAGRPAMRVVQALHWLKDTLDNDGDRVRRRLGAVLSDPDHGCDIKRDLVDGFAHLPIWMQKFLHSIPDFDPGKAGKPLPRGADLTVQRTRRAADAAGQG
jgi:hypothetical protein